MCANREHTPYADQTRGGDRSAMCDQLTRRARIWRQHSRSADASTKGEASQRSGAPSSGGCCRLTCRQICWVTITLKNFCHVRDNDGSDDNDDNDDNQAHIRKKVSARASKRGKRRLGARRRRRAPNRSASKRERSPRITVDYRSRRRRCRRHWQMSERFSCQANGDSQRDDGRRLDVARRHGTPQPFSAPLVRSGGGDSSSSSSRNREHRRLQPLMTRNGVRQKKKVSGWCRRDSRLHTRKTLSNTPRHRLKPRRQMRAKISKT